MCRFLIVEDEEVVAAMMHTILTRNGYTAYISRNSFEGLGLVKQEKHIRAIFVDLHLPGMDGLTFTRKVRKIDPLMYICAMTGYTDFFNVIDARECGADDFLIKPFDAECIKKISDSVYERMIRWKRYKNQSGGGRR